MRRSTTRLSTSKRKSQVVKRGGHSEPAPTHAADADLPSMGFPAIESDNTGTECAFGVKPLPGGVCSLPQQVEKMKEFYTTRLAPNQGSGASVPAERVIQSVKSALKCDTESCIYESPEYQQFVGRLEAERTLEERFLPPGPRNTTQLLTNRHIEAVLRQFAREFQDFVHIPFQMIDFAEQQTELAQFDVGPYLRKGYRRFGCVLNTDTSSGRGKHWFCVFLDFTPLTHTELEQCLQRAPTMLRYTDRCTIEYFNSSGNPARPQIERWCHNKEREWRRTLPGLNLWMVQACHFRHQWSHTECGVYALFYIRQRLAGHPYTNFSRYWIPDEQMIERRKSFFRDPGQSDDRD